MAKMFYSMEEAAEKLGVSPDEIQKMSQEGTLQQFRDRDKVMFKCDQVDSLTKGGADDMTDTSSIPLTPADTSSDTDAIDLTLAVGDDHDKPGALLNSASATGISIFDADEIDDTDPMAQTIVSGGLEDDDDLVIDSVGSGSGLLDLTRESDDTSLGAELLEEIYPAGSDVKNATSAGNIFDRAGGTESGAQLGDLEDLAGGHAMPTPVGGGMITSVQTDSSDPVASGWTGGMLFGVIVALVMTGLIVAAATQGTSIQLTEMFAKDFYMYTGGLAGVTLILTIIGAFVGKAMAR